MLDEERGNFSADFEMMQCRAGDFRNHSVAFQSWRWAQYFVRALGKLDILVGGLKISAGCGVGLILPEIVLYAVIRLYMFKKSLIVREVVPMRVRPTSIVPGL